MPRPRLPARPTRRPSGAGALLAVLLALLLPYQAFGVAFLHAWRPAHHHVVVDPVPAVATVTTTATADLAADTVIAHLEGDHSDAHAHDGVQRHHHDPGTPGIVYERESPDPSSTGTPTRSDRDVPWAVMPDAIARAASRPRDVPAPSPVRAPATHDDDGLLRPPC